MFLRVQILTAVMFLWLPAQAQVSARLSGTLVDPSGAAIPGAKVALTLTGGSAVLMETESSASGSYSLTGLRPDRYDLRVEKAGFRSYLQRGVTLDPGVETVLSAVRLELGTVTESIVVNEQLRAVQTGNAEVATTLTADQVRALPQLDRLVTSLYKTQAGVTSGRDSTVINGQRQTFTNVTLDGINIQDNLFREGGIDYQPNLLSTDQISEFTVFTSNTNASVGGGASQIVLTTRSGGNEPHGAVYWFNRNNATAAGDWFQNRDRVAKAFLNQNQLGASFGGPLIRNKLLFYTNYEALRRREQATLDRTLLTADARQGLFTYRDTSGNVRKVNLLQAANTGMDPATQAILAAMPGAENINNFRRGDSNATLLRNSGGYSFNAQNNRDRDNVTAKLDYYLSPKHVFSGSYLWNRDTIDRNDPAIANDFSRAPAVANDGARHFASLSHRWSPTARFSNDLRGGFNRAPETFTSSTEFGAFIIDAAFLRNGALANNPLNTYRNQGRNSRNYNVSDTASYTQGRHNLQFGWQMQRVVTSPYNDAGTIARYDLGMGTGNPGLTSAALPGISANDLTVANNLLALLGGYVTGYSQTFNITSRTSGFLPNTSDRKTWLLNNYGFFVQDQWKLHRRLSLSLGLRYELNGVVRERDGLTLLPVLRGGDPIASLTDPNGVLDFAPGPLYHRDRNDFAPNLGFAWDVFGNGKTALRGGYAIAYANDNQIAAIRNNVYTTNAGLLQTVTRTGLTGRVSTGRPSITAPVFKVPRTYADNYALDTTTALGMPDPNLRTPYIQQWNFSWQQELKGNVVEIRYVGNKGTKLLRGIDYNQVDINAGGFLADFNRAYSNGNLARASTGSFNPNYNPQIAGSQRLTVFPLLTGGGFLDDATVLGALQRGEVGELANVYQTSRLNGPISFYRNSNATGNNLITNYSNSSYHALQIDVVRRLKAGVQLQANYGFSKVLSDSLGDGQFRFEAFLDRNNGAIERARAPFDLRHVFKMNGVWQLPFGAGHHVQRQGLNWLVGGWALSGNAVWQSGTPFSVLSGRGTLNRAARSQSTNTANTSLSGDALLDMTGLFMTGSGPLFINPSAMGPDGRGAAADGQPRFAGQVFSNPGPGTLGALQRRMFSGPAAFNLDASLQKTVRVREGHSLEIRAEAFNLPNHPSFAVGDESIATSRPRMDINSTTFGQITATQYDRRLFQFGLYYRF